MRVSKTTKMKEWLGLTLRHPGEAIDRLLTVADVQRDRYFARRPVYDLLPFNQVRDEVTRRLTGNGQSFDEELAEVEERIRTRQAVFTANAPINVIHSADFSLARLCYVTCRMLKPEVVVETGVAYGVTSSFLLEALDANGKGVLHSVDLPPLGPQVEDYVGVLVHEKLRSRWTLHRGTTRRVLPGLLDTLGEVDLFVHDSLHTYRNIRFELDEVRSHLAHRAVVLADDVHENQAFQDWVQGAAPDYHAAVQEEAKESILGLALYHG